MPNDTQTVREVIAHNDAADSGNPMHDDAAAKAMNFAGALVPGVTVYGYMTYSALDYFGADWLQQGCMHVRFRRPVYASEKLAIRCEAESSEVIQLETRNPKGEVCVAARASLTGQTGVIPSLPNSAIAPRRALPNRKPPAVRDEFAAMQVLGSIDVQFADSQASAFADAMQDDCPRYRNGVTHPAWLLRQANIIVDRNFNIGPWIHAQSEIQHYALAQNDEPLDVRAQVIDLFERKGHHYADLDVALLAKSTPERIILRVMHRVIYKIAEVA